MILLFRYPEPIKISKLREWVAGISEEQCEKADFKAW